MFGIFGGVKNIQLIWTKGDYYTFKITSSQLINILWSFWGTGFRINEGIQQINDQKTELPLSLNP